MEHRLNNKDEWHLSLRSFADKALPWSTMILARNDNIFSRNYNHRAALNLGMIEIRGITTEEKCNLVLSGFVPLSNSVLS